MCITDLLKIELGRITGQWHQHNLRAFFAPGQRALGLVNAGAIDDQEDEVRLRIGGDDLAIDVLLEVGTALVGAQLEVRLAAPAVHGTEHDLFAVVAGGFDLPRHPGRCPHPGAGGIQG